MIFFVLIYFSGFVCMNVWIWLMKMKMKKRKMEEDEERWKKLGVDGEQLDLADMLMVVILIKIKQLS